MNFQLTNGRLSFHRFTFQSYSLTSPTSFITSLSSLLFLSVLVVRDWKLKALTFGTKRWMNSANNEFTDCLLRNRYIVESNRMTRLKNTIKTTCKAISNSHHFIIYDRTIEYALMCARAYPFRWSSMILQLVNTGCPAHQMRMIPHFHHITTYIWL